MKDTINIIQIILIISLIVLAVTGSFAPYLWDRLKGSRSTTGIVIKRINGVLLLLPGLCFLALWIYDFTFIMDKADIGISSFTPLIIPLFFIGISLCWLYSKNGKQGE